MPSLQGGSDTQNSIHIASPIVDNTLQKWGKTFGDTLYVVIHDTILYVMTAVRPYKIGSVDSVEYSFSRMGIR